MPIAAAFKDASCAKPDSHHQWEAESVLTSFGACFSLAIAGPPYNLPKKKLICRHVVSILISVSILVSVSDFVLISGRGKQGGREIAERR
jgi:hypothetical protein